MRPFIKSALLRVIRRLFARFTLFHIIYRIKNPDILISSVFGGTAVKVVDMRADMAGVIGAKQVNENENDAFGQGMNRKRVENDFRGKLKNLLERIDQQAQKLSERLDIGELKRYRTLVTEFIDISVRHSSEYQREHTLDAKGRHRIFGIVKKIDAELENLTREVLNSQKDYIGVLAKLEDIRGLLVDIIT